MSLSKIFPDRRDAQSFWLCQAASDNGVHPFCTFRMVSKRFHEYVADALCGDPIIHKISAFK